MRYATIADATYIWDLSERMRDSIGYAPRGAIVDRIERQRVLVIEENGSIAGFISHTHRIDRLTHLPQIGVDPALWRTRAGTLVMQTVIQAARDAGSTALTLRSALDLPANFFWPTLGFLPQGIIAGQRRTLSAWAKPLTDRLQFPVHAPPRGAHEQTHMLLPIGVNPAALPRPTKRHPNKRRSPNQESRP